MKSFTYFHPSKDLLFGKNQPRLTMVNKSRLRPWTKLRIKLSYLEILLRQLWIIQTRNGEINQEKICVYFLWLIVCDLMNSKRQSMEWVKALLLLLNFVRIVYIHIYLYLYILKKVLTNSRKIAGMSICSLFAYVLLTTMSHANSRFCILLCEGIFFPRMLLCSLTRVKRKSFDRNIMAVIFRCLM